jgi:hypothetical protein
MDITIDGIPELDADFAAFPAKAQRILVSSLNRGIKSARTFMARAVSQDMGLKVGTVREAMKMPLASQSHPVAELRSPLTRIPLIEFSARGPYPSRGRGRGVTYRIGTKGRGRVETAFIASMKSGDGRLGVYARVGKERIPRRHLRGPSMGHVFARYRAAGLARAEEACRSNIVSQLKLRGIDITDEGGDGD